jgi:oxaloacetate decarboxylase gamma subunit
MENNLLSEVINLTMFGMGFVFLFLALMVIVTNLMSIIISKIDPPLSFAQSTISNNSVEIDKKTRTIIEAAIKLHVKK